MWLMTTLGFFSVACARQGDGSHGKPVDTSRIMIRARVKQHLDALKSRFPNELGRAEIIQTPSADYGWRIICPKVNWAICAKSLAEDISYDNFKDQCASRHGGSSPYLNALHTTWSTFRKTGK